jgi:large subunit ribosomal protein L33
MREKVILICEKCLSRNYNTTRRKYDVNRKLEVTKFCPRCNAHTLHKESR